VDYGCIKFFLFSGQTIQAQKDKNDDDKNLFYNYASHFTFNEKAQREPGLLAIR
jgi:hypothetical protein